MTSDSHSDNPGNEKPPRSSSDGSARSRRDQGDLWSDDVPSTPSSNESPPPPVEPSYTVPPPGSPRPSRYSSLRTPRDEALDDEPRAPEESTSLLEPPLSAAGTGRTSRSYSRAPYTQEPDYEEPVYYEEEDYDDRRGGGGVMLNPFVLAGGAVVAAILLAVFVVFFFGQGGDNNDNSNTAVPSVTPSNDNGGVFIGLRARSVATATVREGPGANFLELGLLRARQDVDVTGRNEDATWFEIVFPANSNLRGWVAATALQLPEDVLNRVAVVDGSPISTPQEPSDDEPTPTPAATEEPDDDDGDEDEEEPTPTPTTEPGDTPASIGVAIVSDCTFGSPIMVLVSNLGDTALESTPIQVIVDNDGVTVYDQPFVADIGPGESAPLATGVPAEPVTMTVSVVLTESGGASSSARCMVQGGGGNLPPPIGN